jgi:hypothetical protein
VKKVAASVSSEGTKDWNEMRWRRRGGEEERRKRKED